MWKRTSGKRLSPLLLLLLALPCACVEPVDDAPEVGPVPSDAPEQEPASLDTSEAAVAARLRAHVVQLATEIGPRCGTRPAKLALAADYIEAELAQAGYTVARQSYLAGGHTFENLIAELPGSSGGTEWVVVGAHYDTCYDTPGADDNASGVAGVLELAAQLKSEQLPRNLRFVAFASEEPPHFGTDEMGSHHAARASAEAGERVTAMYALECLGYYSDEPDSQAYPPPLSLLYPSTGNFIAFVGNLESSALVQRSTQAFRGASDFPCESASLPGEMPGVWWSDHWNYWREGFSAVMVTDTAPHRTPHYHEPTDIPEHLDYDRMARVVGGLAAVVRSEAGKAE